MDGFARFTGRPVVIAGNLPGISGDLLRVGKRIVGDHSPGGGNNSAPIRHTAAQRDEIGCASYCGEKLYKEGFKYHDFIFENQDFFHGVSSNDDVDQKICSLDESRCAQMKECMSSEDAMNWVKTAAKEGEDAKITGTPTIFVNGKKLDGGQNFMILKSLFNDIN